FLLFPAPALDRRNPLSPDSLTFLPGPIGGRENGWIVTSRGGREHFLVVASPEPVAALEQELVRVPRADPGRALRGEPGPAPAGFERDGAGTVPARQCTVRSRPIQRLAGDALPRAQREDRATARPARFDRLGRNAERARTLSDRA